MDVEFLIRDIEATESIRWVSTKLGQLVQLEVSEGIHYFRTEAGNIHVTVTPHMDDGPFLSVYVSGEQLPWKSSQQLAAPCAQELGKTVRWCDEASNGWREKRGSADVVAIEWDV